MILILISICASLASAITFPAWATNTNGNLGLRQFNVYPAQPYQQNYYPDFTNNYEILQNPSFVHPAYYGPFLQGPSVANTASHNVKLPEETLQNVRIHQNPPLQYFILSPNQPMHPQRLRMPPQNPNWFLAGQNIYNSNPKNNFVESNSIGQIHKNERVPLRNGDAPKNRKSPNKSGNSKKTKARENKKSRVNSDPAYNHEIPQEIPTKPIYPGEGQWARPGLKHRPYISKQKYVTLSDSKEDNGMGRDIFNKVKQDFASQENKFRHSLGEHPQKLNVRNYSQATRDYDYDEDTPGEEFVPYRTYSQVRKSETTEHLPSRPPEDERLKESIKDSKIHTVYSEEGYEDSAYDHADREKNADSTEKYADVNDKSIITKMHRNISKKPKLYKSADVAAEKANAPPEAFENSSEISESKIETTTDVYKNVKRVYVDDLLGIDQQVNPKFETTTANLYHEDAAKIYVDAVGEKQKDFGRIHERNADDQRQLLTASKIGERGDQPSLPVVYDEQNVEKLTNKNLIKKLVNYKDPDDDTVKIIEKTNMKLVTTADIDHNKHLTDTKEDHLTTDAKQIEEIEDNNKKDEFSNSSLSIVGNKNVAAKANQSGKFNRGNQNGYLNLANPKESGVEESSKIGNRGDEYDLVDSVKSEKIFGMKISGKNPTYNSFIRNSTSKSSSSLSPGNLSVKKDVYKVSMPTNNRQNIGRTKRSVNAEVPTVEPKNFVDQTNSKYPYYNSDFIDKNSPLRYSENSSNVPKKMPGVMAFYDQADKVECEEVVDVDPVPKRVRQSEGKEKSEDVEGLSSGPKLGKLGDTIDCFKAKYFGENPLDNPFFKEENIEAPETIFYSPDENEKFSGYNDARVEAEEEILDRAGNDYEAGGEAKGNSKFVDDGIMERISSSVSEKDRKAKVSDILLGQQDSSSSVNHILKDLSTSNDKSDLNMTVMNEDTPQALPYLRKRKRKIPYRRKPYGMNNRFIPKQNNIIPAVYNSYTPSPKRISEVHYKDEIKPDEQLNVFTDIINNIKNSSKDSIIEPSEFSVITSEITPYKRHKRRKLPRRTYKMKTTTSLPVEISTDDVLKNFYYTSTARPVKNPTSTTYLNAERNNQIFEEFPGVTNYDSITERHNEKTKQMKNYNGPTSWTPMSADQLEKEHRLLNADETVVEKENNHRTQHINHRLEESIGETTNVYGLLPPKENAHKINNNHKFTPAADLETAPSNYYIIGMRPPPPIKRLHSSYQQHNHVKKRRVTYPYRRRIVRRSAKRGYSEIRRESKKPEENPEEDDYTPHRPRTFHYDVEKGQIVYDKKQESKEEEPESYEYVDDVEEVTHPPKRRKEQKKDEEKKEERKLEFPSKPPEGPTYIDFIKQLKSHPSYQEIPDPKSTEKTTTTTTSTEATVTTQPEFLNILSQVRNDKNYVAIPDKTTPKPTAQPEKEENASEEEEEVLKNVQNSPGGQILGFDNSGMQIFDISEYLPKAKNYNPRTNVDTSKYKSIERVSVARHNISSKYNSEEDPPLEDSNPAGEPVITAQRRFVSEERESVEESSNVAQKVPENQANPRTVTTTIKTQLHRVDSPTPETTVATKATRITSRGRRRPTTTQSAKSEAIDSTTKASTRRLRTRGRSRATTSSPIRETRATTRNRRNLQRRYNKNSIPKNHKSSYSPIQTDATAPRMKAKHAATPRVITAETILKTNVTNLPKINETKNTKHKNIEDVEVFKDYDKKQKHGGNYKYKKVEISISEEGTYVPPTAFEIEDSEEIKRLADVVPKPFAFYSDPKLPSRVNLLKESNREEEEDISTDETKDHGDFFEDVVKVNFEEMSSTSKPVFIKDPSKRLYFYAPV